MVPMTLVASESCHNTRFENNEKVTLGISKCDHNLDVVASDSFHCTKIVISSGGVAYAMQVITVKHTFVSLNLLLIQGFGLCSPCD